MRPGLRSGSSLLDKCVLGIGTENRTGLVEVVGILGILDHLCEHSV